MRDILSPSGEVASSPPHSRMSLIDRVRLALTPTVVPSHRPSLSTLAWLLAVVGGIQFIMLRPPFPSDSMEYFGWAQSLRDNAIGHGTTRLGVLLPVRVAIELFGVSEAAYYIVPFVLTLGLVGATYVVGAQLAGARVGLVAALTMASSTLVLNSSSQIVPDPFATTWFVTGVACFLTARYSARRNRWLTLGAVSIGLAYLCREYVVFMAPVVLLLGWTSGWRRRDWARLAIVLAAVLAVETLLMLFVFGDPFARLKALVGFAETGASGERPLLAAYGAGANRITVLTRAPKTFMVFDVGKLLMLSVPIGVVLAVLDRRQRWAWGFLLVWIASLWVPMMFLAGILDPQSPLIRDNHVRYWYLVIPALYLLLGVLVSFGARMVGNRTASFSVSAILVLVLAGAVVSDITAVNDRELFRGLGATQWDEVRDWLRADGENIDRIYTDDRMARVLPIYTRGVFGGPIWDGEIVLFEQGGEFVPKTDLDGALLLHRLGLRYLRNRDLRVPDDYLQPGPNWEVVARRADGSLTILVERTP